jgi:zinc transport system permease protein
MTEELPQLSQFFDAWVLFRDPTLTGTLAGATLGMLGVYVVLRRMVFLAAAVSQAASFGVAGTYYLKLHLAFSTVWAPKLGAFMMTLAALWLVASDKSHKHHRRDSLLGFVFLACASGTLVVGKRFRISRPYFLGPRSRYYPRISTSCLESRWPSRYSMASDGGALLR